MPSRAGARQAIVRKLYCLYGAAHAALDDAHGRKGHAQGHIQRPVSTRKKRGDEAEVDDDDDDDDDDDSSSSNAATAPTWM